MDTYANYDASHPSKCSITIYSEGTEREQVHETGKLLVARMGDLLKVADHCDALFHVGKIQLWPLIPYTGYYTFCKFSLAQISYKFLFNRIPSMMQIPKILYSELLISYGFIYALVPASAKESLLPQGVTLLVCSDNE